MRSVIIAFLSAIIITRVTIARAGLRNHVDLRQAGAQHTGAYFVQLTKRQFRCLSRSPSPPNQQHDTVGLSRNDAAVIDGQNRRGIEHNEIEKITQIVQQAGKSGARSEENKTEPQSLMRSTYA